MLFPSLFYLRYAKLIIAHFIVFIICIFLALGCSSHRIGTKELLTKLAEFPNATDVFFLEFDSLGRVINDEIEFAIIEKMKLERYDRVVVLAFGWNNDKISASNTCTRILNGLFVETEGRLQHLEERKTCIVCVIWDSKSKPVSRLVNDFIPLPGIGMILSGFGDALLFPFSYYSKFRTADFIGYHGLTMSMNRIFTSYFKSEFSSHEMPKLPSVHLIGHSFGCRILLYMIKFVTLAEEIDRDTNSNIENISEHNASIFWYAPLVRSAFFIQPALSTHEIRATGSRWARPGLGAHIPVYITHSEYDRAINTLFPISNLFLNFATVNPYEANDTEKDKHILSGPVWILSKSRPESHISYQNYDYIKTKILTFLQSTEGSCVDNIICLAEDVHVGDAGTRRPQSDLGETHAELGRIDINEPPQVVYDSGRHLILALAQSCFANSFLPINIFASIMDSNIVYYPIDTLATLSQFPILGYAASCLNTYLRRNRQGFFNLGPFHNPLGSRTAPSNSHNFF